MNSIPLYLCWDGDHVQDDVKRIEQSDEPDRLRILFQKIDRANEIVRAWVLSVGGSVISINGCAGSAEVPAEKVADLPKIRVQYSEAIESPFSVGVGTKLSEAQKALDLLGMKGGDNILLYTPDVDQEIAERNKEEQPIDPLEKGLGNAVVGALSAGLVASAPAQQPHKVIQPWTPVGLEGDMFPIAHLESSFGKRVNHKPSPAGPFHTATGAVGLKPVTAHEEFLHNPDLQRRYPTLFDKQKFLEAMQSDVPFYNQIASSYWNRIKTQLRNKMDRVAFAWRWGKTAALHADPNRVKSDPYVKKYMALKAKGIYKMEHEDFDLEELVKDEGFDKPIPEASEHSQGEATEHLFEEAKQKMNPDVEGHLHKLAQAQKSNDTNSAAKEDTDKELAQLKSGVLNTLQHVQKLQPQFEELAQSAPEVYKTLLEMIQSMIALARELDASPIEKSEEAVLQALIKGTDPYENWLPVTRPSKEEVDHSLNHMSFQQHAKIPTTPEFNDWFKGSRVTTKDGKPLVSFHGTNKNFTSFNTSPAPRNSKAQNINWSGELGSYFAAPSLHAGNYDEGNAEAMADVFAEHRSKKMDGGHVMPVYLSIKNPFETGDYEELSDYAQKHGSWTALRQYLERLGHDGVVVRNSMTDGDADRDDWVAFHPHQIKSAIGNNGSFDPSNPHIGKAELPSQEEIDHKPEDDIQKGNIFTLPGAKLHWSKRGVSRIDGKSRLSVRAGTPIFEGPSNPDSFRPCEVSDCSKRSEQGYTLCAGHQHELMQSRGQKYNPFEYKELGFKSAQEMQKHKLTEALASILAEREGKQQERDKARAAKKQASSRAHLQIIKDELPPSPAPQPPQSQYGTGILPRVKIPTVPKPFTRHHLNLPVGTKIDGEGKIKVQHGDGKTSWIQARAGQIASQDNDSQGVGGEVHPISSRNPTGR